MISCIIPAYKEPYLQKTIDSFLDNAEGEIEVIAILDGCWQEVKDDPRVHVLHLGKTVGMRDAINAGVRLSKGEYIMRADAHCTFGKGYDRILTERFKDDWIVYPMRYYLDPEKWEIMDKPPNVYNKLLIDPKYPKFAGFNWKSREIERKDKMIDESMAMQGSVWIMKRSWWDTIGELETEGYGPQNQDSIEMVFKTWKKGGRLMVNKNTWHSHKHRDFNRTHNWQGQGELVRKQYRFVIDLWGDYYKEIKSKWNV